MNASGYNFGCGRPSTLNITVSDGRGAGVLAAVRR